MKNITLNKIPSIQTFGNYIIGWNRNINTIEEKVLIKAYGYSLLANLMQRQCLSAKNQTCNNSYILMNCGKPEHTNELKKEMQRRNIFNNYCFWIELK